MSPARVDLCHRFAVPAARLWAIAVDFAALARCSAPLVRFRVLPSGRVAAGQVLDVHVSMFGLLPWQPYRMQVIACDDAERVFVSEESGAGVRQWRHTCSVTQDGDGAVLHDRIEIDAGRLTPLVAAWARLLYRRRHPVRQRMFDEGWGRAIG